MEKINKKSMKKSRMVFLILGTLVVTFFIYNSPLGDVLKHQPTLEELKTEKGPDGQPIIFWRIKEEDRKTVTSMLDIGYDIETEGWFGATPVIGASMIDDWITVLLLLERGANPLVADGRGFTLAKLIGTSRVDLDGHYGVALVKVRTFLKENKADTVYEPSEVKEMLEKGEWPAAE